MKSTFESLKKASIKMQQPLVCAFDKNGEMLIYVSNKASNDEVMSALLVLATQLTVNRLI